MNLLLVCLFEVIELDRHLPNHLGLLHSSFSTPDDEDQSLLSKEACSIDRSVEIRKTLVLPSHFVHDDFLSELLVKDLVPGARHDFKIVAEEADKEAQSRGDVRILHLLLRQSLVDCLQDIRRQPQLRNPDEVELYLAIPLRGLTEIEVHVLPELEITDELHFPEDLSFQIVTLFELFFGKVAPQLFLDVLQFLQIILVRRMLLQREREQHGAVVRPEDLVSALVIVDDNWEHGVVLEKNPVAVRRALVLLILVDILI